MSDPRARPVLRDSYMPAAPAARGSANLGDILERVLDRGIVIAGDIRVNLLDIELLTIKLRLVIASVDTARELGIDWWEHDPWLTGKNRELLEENRRLRDRLAAVEQHSSLPRSPDSEHLAPEQTERTGEAGRPRGTERHGE
ncbi:gas vesicle protein [Sphaerimonospora cavernae]|uniref:Gas vesicle protein n=1 Tax=Sphaerimonospora cavernae TaxID=1740611 RepID=A0ABV6U063_9ACTN